MQLFIIFIQDMLEMDKVILSSNIKFIISNSEEENKIIYFNVTYPNLEALNSGFGLMTKHFLNRS